MNRPRVFIVFGVINLLFAAGWMLNGFISLIVLAFSPEFYTNNNPMGVDTAPILATYAALESPVFKSYWIANGILGLLAGGLIGLGGVGLLMARPWGRRLSLIWSVAAVLLVAVSVGMMNGYFVPAYASQTNEPLPGSVENALAIVGSLILRWAYPVVLMVLLPRPKVTAMFEQAGRLRAARAHAQPSPVLAAAPPQVAPSVMPAQSQTQAQVQPAVPAPPGPQAQTPSPALPPPPPPAQRTWRDDPWNDPDVT
ncbi:MAG: hypothetical protein AAGA29_05270 [Planctomycetota bacterium]